VIPWKELGRAQVGSDQLILSKRGDELSIRMRGAELMNSRQHASEETLARIGCAKLATVSKPRVLVGGLGMGFTLRAALDALPGDASVHVVELVPEVVAWNKEHLGHLAREPLADKRVTLEVADVATVIGAARASYNAILLDVDNGPDAFTAPANAGLYGIKGLIAARNALVPGGVLGVWSVENDNAFTDRLTGAGFAVDKQRVPSRPNSTVKHVLWFGVAPVGRGAPAKAPHSQRRPQGPSGNNRRRR
jgi:spermidine synthase